LSRYAITGQGMKPHFPQLSKNKMSKINAADLLCWLSGQASVGFLPLAENKLSDFGFD